MPIIKTLTIITTAPDQTFGDVSGAFKLIEGIYETNTEGFKIEVNWVVNVTDVSKPEDVELYLDFFEMAKQLGVKLLSNYSPNNRPINIAGILLSLIEVTDLFVCFPVYTGFRLSNVIFKHNKPLLMFSEYNVTSMFLSPENLAVSVKIGLGRQKMGIFIDSSLPKWSSENYKPNINELTLFSKIGLVDAFHGAINQAQIDFYASNHVLYFSYFNKMRANNDLVNKKTFFLIVLLLQARKNPKIDVDIIVRLDGLKFNNSDADISDKFVIQELDLIKDFYFKIEIIDRNGNKTDTLILNNDQSLPSVRLIDPFPIGAKGFKFLLSISQPLAGLTGDQSLSEGITNANVIFYQSMPWKCNLFDEFMKLCNQHLGEDSKLLDFFAMIRKNKMQPLSSQSHAYLIKIVDYIHSHESELLDEMRRIKIFILARYNLKENIIPRLRAAILDPSRIRELFNPYAVLAKGITMLNSQTTPDPSSQVLFASQVASLEIQSIREVYDNNMKDEKVGDRNNKRLKHTPSF